jgi:hypothetical protein
MTSALTVWCLQLFCTYDDYNWDWSLMRVNMECLKERLHVIYTKAPRVFHIGDWCVDLSLSLSLSHINPGGATPLPNRSKVHGVLRASLKNPPKVEKYAILGKNFLNF